MIGDPIWRKPYSESLKSSNLATRSNYLVSKILGHWQFLLNNLPSGRTGSEYSYFSLKKVNNSVEKIDNLYVIKDFLNKII